MPFNILKVYALNFIWMLLPAVCDNTEDVLSQLKEATY